MKLFSMDFKNSRKYHENDEILLVDLLNNTFRGPLSPSYVSKLSEGIFEQREQILVRIFYNKEKNRIGLEVRDFDSGLTEVIKLNMTLARKRLVHNGERQSPKPKFKKTRTSQLRDGAFGPQVLRAGFIAVLLKNGVPIEAVRQLVGHQSSRTTALYSSLACDLNLKQIHRAFHTGS